MFKFIDHEKVMSYHEDIIRILFQLSLEDTFKTDRHNPHVTFMFVNSILMQGLLCQNV